MNLICITESELSQWVSRRYFDALTARIMEGRESLTTEIFCTSPYLKLDDARGRIIVNLKWNWRNLSLRLKAFQHIDFMSIPVDAILEIAPAMDQYAKRLGAYQLPIAEWSVEKIWDEWLINQAVMETRRAIVSETVRIGCVDRGVIHNEDFVSLIIRKSLRPEVVLGSESLLMGWANVLEKRDAWLHWLRVEGHLDNPSMLKASAEKISNDLGYQSANFNFELVDEDRGWKIQDITADIIQEFSRCDSYNSELQILQTPPIFCMTVYLRLYDEIQHGNKDWRVIFNLLRLTKYSVNALHADILTVTLLASLKAEEIYSFGLRDAYMS